MEQTSLMVIPERLPRRTRIIRFNLIDVIVELGVSFIIMPLLLGIALNNMASQSTAGWSSETVLLWGLLGMIFIAACVIAVIAHAKNAGKF